MVVGIGIGIPFSGSGAGVGPWAPPEPNPNLLLWSEQFQQAAWEKSLVTVTPDAVNDPLGALTADLLDPDSSVRSIFQTSPEAVTPGATYTASLYVLAGPEPGGEAALRIEDGVGLTVSTIDPTASWQRMSVTRTTDAGATLLRVRILPDEGAGTAVYAWGAKLEEGSVATAYVKREGV